MKLYNDLAEWRPLSSPSEDDLLKTFGAAAAHLEKDGLLFIAPDCFREIFKPSTSHGGCDLEDRSLRYLEWVYDSDPDDNLIESEFVYIFKDKTGKITVECDSSVNAVFPKGMWKVLLEQSGFTVSFDVINHSEYEPGDYIGIVGKICSN